MVCRRCGFRISKGVSGIGLGHAARKEAEESFNGKSPARGQLSKKTMEMAERLSVECLEEQRKRLQENAVCPKRSLMDILLRKPGRGHDFRVFAYMD